jgi:hypothetical protein
MYSDELIKKIGPSKTIDALTEHANFMHRSDSLQHLFCKALEMHVSQRLFALNDLMQVAVH